MNLEEKKSRLRELRSIKFPNDDEHAEIERLEDDIALSRSESRQETKGLVNKIIPVKKVRRSLLDIVKEKMKPKPVTNEELIELKRESIKYKLKADIEQSKEKIRKAKGEKLQSLLGPGNRSNTKIGRSCLDDLDLRALTGNLKEHETRIRNALKL